MIILLVLLVIVVVLAFFGVYVVPQQSIYIIERLGKFHKVSGAGIHAMIPFIDRRAAIMDMRIRQLENTIVTKTKDDTFVSMEVAVQFRIDKNRVYEAFYELSSPQVRSSLTSRILCATPFPASRWTKRSPRRTRSHLM